MTSFFSVDPGRSPVQHGSKSSGNLPMNKIGAAKITKIPTQLQKRTSPPKQSKPKSA